MTIIFFCFSETDRAEAFKIGQPVKSELFNLAEDVVLTWKPLDDIMCIGFEASPAVEKSILEVEEVRSMLLGWKESLGSRASYRELARVLNTTFINAHDLVKKHCHDKGK